jgi:hypothetical protein
VWVSFFSEPDANKLVSLMITVQAMEALLLRKIMLYCGDQLLTTIVLLVMNVLFSLGTPAKSEAELVLLLKNSFVGSLSVRDNKKF